MAARAVLSRPGFRDLLIGQAVSSFGDWMGTVALMALVLDLTGSATAVGVILVLRLLPAGFAGPIAAGVAERWDRRRIMLACDLVRAGLVALVPLVRAAWWVYLWAFLLEVANLVFLPARDASIPDLVDGEEELPAANGIILGSSYGNIPIGAGAFALLSLVPTGWNGYLHSHSNALALWLDGATYLVSFAFIRRLGVLGPASADSGQGDQAEQPRGVWAGVVAALRLPIVRAVLPATVTAVIGVGALFSLGVVYVRQVLHASTGEFGGMVALFGVGGIAGWAWLQRQRGGPTLATIKLAAAAMGVILAIMSLLSAVELAYVAAVPFGAAGASALVASITYLQETLAGDQRMLGLTVYHIVFRVGMSVAAIGGGLAAQAFGPTRLPLIGTLEPAALVLFCAGLVMVLGAALMPITVKDAIHGEGRQVGPRDRDEAGGGVVEQRDGREAAR
ncbi:MAG TPA: MFS transporter [Actinomycetota bacterium]|jgi:dTMP kinase|nr:MFS transporter [Actinomycetota bacterium]